MKFDNRTMQVLKNFSFINPSRLFTQGNVLKTQSPTSAVLAIATLDQSFDSQFAIYDLSRLLGVMTMFKEPDLQIEDKYMLIKDGSTKSVKYTFTDPSSIIAPKPNVQVRMPDTLASLKVTSDQLSDVLRAASLLKFTDIAFIGRDGKISMSAIDASGKIRDTYDIGIGETDKIFQINIKVENLKLLPGDYEVLITKGILHWTGERIEYYTGAEANSTF